MAISFNSENAPEPVGAYPHAKKVGGLLFLSGVGPRKRGSIDIPGVTLSKNGEVLNYSIFDENFSTTMFLKILLLVLLIDIKKHDIFQI